MNRSKRIVCCFGIVFLAGMSAVFSQQIIAHRGASYLAPENTVAAARLGYELGADAVEIDIHLSADGHIMVNHDNTTKRTTGGIDLTIAETNAEELRKLDVGAWKSAEYKAEKMPFLKEILEVVPEGRSLVVEVKTGPEILPFLQKEIEESGKKSQVILISFNKEVVVQGKQMMPEIPVFWLLHNFSSYSLEEAIDTAVKFKFEGLNVFHELVTPESRQKMKEADLKVYTYTVNDAETGRRLRKMGVDGITTDRPRWLKQSIQF